MKKRIFLSEFTNLGLAIIGGIFIILVVTSIIVCFIVRWIMSDDNELFNDEFMNDMLLKHMFYDMEDIFSEMVYDVNEDNR